MRTLFIILFLLIPTALLSMPNDQMKADEIGTGLVKRFEGWRSSEYYCSANRRTLGWGFTGKLIAGKTTMTKAEGRKIFKVYQKRFESVIIRKVTRKLQQYEFNALFSGVFNFGDRLRGDLLSAINRGDNQRFAREWYKIRYAAGKELRGLANRRLIEIDLYNDLRQDYFEDMIRYN